MLARFPTPTSSDRAALSWRWVVVLLASALLHLFAFEWASGKFVLPTPDDEKENIVTTVQLDPPAIMPTPLQTQAKVKPRPKHIGATHAPLAPAVAAAKAMPEADPTPSTALTTGLTPDAPPAPTVPVTDENSTAVPTPASPPASEQKAETPVAEASQTRYKIDLPPPAELKYNVQKVSVDGTTIHGRGTISWQSGGGHYQVNGEVSWLFITALSFKSEGVLDDYGIAPVLYMEKHFHRSETNTHFNRDERNSISFSASTVSYPRQGGEQDRGSIMWQMAAIGRGDREKFAPGAQIDLFVAGVRDGSIWSILVAGQEEIEVGGGKTLAWHVVRSPRPGTYDQKIDIWLAPQYAWYPVKVRYTDKNGDYLDMSMSSFHPLQLANTSADSVR